MDQLPLVTPVSVLVLFGLAMWVAVAVWATVYRRWRAGLPLLPFQPRRQVPWRGVDMAMILVVYIGAMSGAAGLARLVLGSEITQPLPASAKVNEHILVQLFVSGNVWTVIACLIMAAGIAPLAEEILFRLFLQGWLESLDRRVRRFMPGVRGWARWGTLPVMVSSLLFALPHIRDSTQYGLDFLLLRMIGGALATLTTVAFAVALARLARGATAADLGFDREKILPDIGLGLVAFGSIAAPLFAAQSALLNLVPPAIAPDPFVLFPFALVLGTLYCRTHRIVPAIVLHAALNTTSLVLLWLQMLG
ncbi:MAG: CPBP family glutamic-type intramembrane protease [Planctomycetia bacterium]|nr:CPBP family glutamic-type intramembrane protease [Planctomycetia bacterium]